MAQNHDGSRVIAATDHGRPMSLREYDHAVVREGHRYELSRGIVTVSPMPSIPHAIQVFETRMQLFRCRTKPTMVVASAGECKLMIEPLQSERHPDLTIYQTAPPFDNNDGEVWWHWIPEIVIEVASAGTAYCDYELKPEEYLLVGVHEYWILDREQQQMVVHLRRGGNWSRRTLFPGDNYTTRLLPGIEFDCRAVFEAADQ